MTGGAEYGRALFLLTEETGETETAAADMNTVSQLLSDYPEYVSMLDTPALTRAEKLTLIDEAFSSLPEYIVNLLKLLSEKHSVHVFKDTVREFVALYEQSRGIEHAEAVTAFAMTKEQLERLADKLSQITGKRIILKNTVDASILGGVKLRYSGRQVDTSLKTRLESFEASLKNTII